MANHPTDFTYEADEIERLLNELAARARAVVSELRTKAVVLNGENPQSVARLAKDLAEALIAADNQVYRALRERREAAISARRGE